MDILEIEILTDNLHETEKFYSELLGLQTTNKDQNSISVLAGQSTLTFIESVKLNPKYHFVFNIPHNKLDEAIIWASAKLDLIKIADKLVEKNNLYFFAKGSKSEKFVALGNDNGLFIIVETNRKWYPTEQQAEKHYTKIKITTDGLTRVITMNEENVSR